jgi:DNA-binding SARP family transcriptional activator
MTVFSLHLFGAPTLTRDGAPVSLDTRKALALLAYLALSGERHSRDHLAGLLWPEYPQSQARASLRRTLSVLHQALDESLLDISRESLGLLPESGLQVDVYEFRRLISQCQSHGHPANQTCTSCLEALESAVSLYHGDFLAGFGLRDSPAFDDWQYLQQESLRHEMISVLERLTSAFIARHEFEPAIRQALRWIELDHLHETAHRQLMLLYTWTNNRSAALHQYRNCVRALEEALGVAPLEATTQLYEAIRENRPPAPPELRSSGDTPVAAAPGDRRSETPAPAETALALREIVETAITEGAAAPAAYFPLIERDFEWSKLLEAYRGLSHDSARTGHLIVLEGEAGIGKTRLAEEFMSYVARDNRGIAISARCYEGEANLAYRPLISAIRSALSIREPSGWIDLLPQHLVAESARLVPELAERRKGLPPPPPLETPGSQTRFFEGLAYTLLAATSVYPSARDSGRRSTVGSQSMPVSARGILFLDDIQWADRASLDVLTYIVRRFQEFPLCLLLTWRKVEVPNSPRVHRLIAEAERGGHVTLVSLSRMSLAGVRKLAESRGVSADTPGLDELADQLYHETEGLPLFLVEYLASVASGLHSAGTGTAAGDAGARWSLPGGVRELLQLRLATVGESSLQILAAAAVIGRSFDFATLWSASGRSEEETVEALEDLISQGLVVEVGPAGSSDLTYDFTHEKLRTLVYEETSLARRRLLHRRVAEALSRRLGGQREPSSLAGQIARHYLEAGAESEAAQYFKIAGERARALYANVEALDLLGTALALGHPDTAGLHEAIGDLHTFLGTYGDALKSYEIAAALASQGMLPALEHKIGGVYARRGNFNVAESHFEAAVDALDTLEATSADGGSSEKRSLGQRARIYADWSLAARNQGKRDLALDLAERARDLAESANDPQARAQARNMLGILAASQGRLEEAVRQLEESLALSEALPSSAARVAALNNLALALGASGDTGRAIEMARAALALCISEGDRHREAALHNNLADLLHTADQSSTEAVAHVRESVAIYAEIGVEQGTVQPEIWKLAEW